MTKIDMDQKIGKRGVLIMFGLLFLFLAVAICGGGGGNDSAKSGSGSGGGVYEYVPDLSDPAWDMYYECTQRQRDGGWNLVEAANRCEKLRP